MWNAEQYEQFRGERSRPFFDLLGRIPDRGYRSIVDLGCGTGDLTAALGDHWPDAHVWGVDLSAEMLAPARERQVPGHLEFIQADLAGWRPARPIELAVSNAAFQWVADQAALLPFVVSYLAPGGVLAVQVPDNFSSPSHELLDQVKNDGPWATKLRAQERPLGVLPVAEYSELLRAQGMEVDAWETTYQHVLRGTDAVLEWMKGTALRPVLRALEADERDRFLQAYGEKLRTAYPSQPHGTIFPFRRLFFVARKT